MPAAADIETRLVIVTRGPPAELVDAFEPDVLGELGLQLTHRRARPARLGGHPKRDCGVRAHGSEGFRTRFRDAFGPHFEP